MINSELQTSIYKVQRRYITMALITALICSGGLVVMGFAPLGKGLAAGAIFSVLNFWLMAKALPARIGHGRAKTFFISITSMFGRFALLALPIVIAIKLPSIAVSTVAIGLFAIPLTILAENIWQQWRQSQEGGI